MSSRNEARESVETPSGITSGILADLSFKPSPHSFDAPAEADWHRMISVAAYYRAEQRGFSQGGALDDWLRAEAEVKSMLVS